MTEEDEAFFTKVVVLGCGETVDIGKGLEELFGIARLVDRYQVEAIQSDVEQAVLDRLTVENCGPMGVLCFCSRQGLRVRGAA